MTQVVCLYNEIGLVGLTDAVIYGNVFVGTSAAESSQMKGGRWKTARNRRGVVVHQAGKDCPKDNC